MQNFFLIANTPDGVSSSGVSILMLAFMIPFFIFLFIVHFVIYFFIFSAIDKRIDEEVKRFRNSIILSSSSIVSYLSMVAFGYMVHVFNLNIGYPTITYCYLLTFLLTAFIFVFLIMRAILHNVKIKIKYKVLIISIIYLVTIAPFLIMMFF